MLYESLRPFALYGLRQFYRDITLKGALPASRGPVLVIANHPNVVLDGLIVLNTYSFPLWFVAKGSLFRNRVVARFFHSLRLVPIFGKEFSGEARARDNEIAFGQVFSLFDRGESVLIFPEGVNTDPRRIEQFKTGTARIALQYQQRNDFRSPLVIQPIGLTYLDRKRFRDAVTVNVGEPIDLRSYERDFQADAMSTVQRLTDELHDTLSGLVGELHTDQHRALVDKIVKLYRSAGRGGDDLSRIRNTATAVERFVPEIPEKAREIEKRLDYYLALCSSLMLDGSASLDTPKNQLFSIVLVPVVIFGLLVNYPPFRVIMYLTEKFSEQFSGRRASWAFSLGFFIFPLWYLTLSLSAYLVSQSILTSLLVLVLLLVSSALLNSHFQSVALFFFKNVWPARRSPLDVLRTMRGELLDELEAIRHEESAGQKMGESGLSDKPQNQVESLE
ncbi:MAG: 1-acyl-sn-glycerol-3-phosphate acyltransferase [Bdellovibrionales bacterium]|nr:1-acyl-sn-glycerol-3-phosphate acyltransferase [Bdellovibrionales bacterium]